MTYSVESSTSDDVGEEPIGTSSASTTELHEKSQQLSPSPRLYEVAPTVVTPLQRRIVAPVLITQSDEQKYQLTEDSIDPHSSIQIQLRAAQADAQQSAAALEHLLNGIRSVKKLLDLTTQTANVSDVHTEISSISNNLPGVLGSELLSLTNTADRVRQSQLLANDESTSLISDVNHWQQQAQESKMKLEQTQSVSRKMYQSNQSLRQTVNQLRQERKVLIREVKSLRSQAEHTRQSDNWRLLEHHVLDSIAFHEKILKTPSPQSHATAAVVSSFDFVEAPHTSQQDEEWETPLSDEIVETVPTHGKEKVAPIGEQQQTSNCASEPKSSVRARPHSHSPVPSLGESTDEDSWSDTRGTGKEEKVEKAACGDAMPDSVTCGPNEVATAPPSPLCVLGPTGCPVDESSYVPLSSRVLRTLAVPSVDRGSVSSEFDCSSDGGLDTLIVHSRLASVPTRGSASTQVSNDGELGALIHPQHGLYEC